MATTDKEREMPGQTTMRTVVMDRFGPPDVLHVTRVPVPEPGHGEVLVAVHAAAVNAIDWKTRAGRGVPVESFPAVLGWDISGTVVATGPGTSRLQVADEVFGMLRFPELAGGYAEYVAAPEDELARKPATIAHRTAAGAMVALTAWETLFEQAGLVAGQRVLVHGAAGGVGHIAVQLAGWAGAAVIATASVRNRAFLLGLGAHEIVDYTTTRVEDAVRDVDVVVDTRGGVDFVRLLGTLRPGGIIVTILGHDLSQDEAVEARGVRAGFTYVAPNAATLDRVGELIAAGSLRIHPDRAFPLERVADAHAVGEGGHVRGLLLLELQ
jgi:NADPH:quinone reductase-like Zn-dependent oxidoreductase